jgi:hypothetical protein
VRQKQDSRTLRPEPKLVQQGKQVSVGRRADAQRSSSQWCSRMEPSIATQVLQSPDDLLDQLTDLVATVHYLVVDGPAGLSESTSAILMRVDLGMKI